MQSILNLSLDELRLVRKILAGLCLIVLFVMLIDQTVLAVRHRIPKASLQGDLIQSLETVRPAEALESYLSPIMARNLFNVATSSQSSGQAIQRVTLDELVKDYRLKGIIVIGEPEAIIVDARTQVSTFVKKGDRLGEVEVRSIGNETVVVGYGDEETELTMEGGTMT